MEYRRLGSAGLKVSELSFGSWVTFKGQLDDSHALEMMKLAYDAGVNFFDNAEVYAGGESEIMMGRAIKKLGWRRASYVISTKFFWGLHDGPNEKDTLNRKYLMQAIDGSLQRLQLEYVDLVYCHRPDPHTPMEEIVRAMSDMISQGKALYWGTSEWSAEQIMEAWKIADRRNLHKPQVEQPQYNILVHERVEKEYARLYSEIGLGLTTWGPLRSGLLSGKYGTSVPQGSRASLPGYEWLHDRWSAREREIIPQLAEVAADIGCSMSQLAIAWILKNANVSSVILGASRAEQLRENLAATAFTAQLSPDVLARIAQIVDGYSAKK
jgi:voltage-dependent potassium channel beta subunit